MLSTEYSKSISEVLDILKHTNKDDVDKISPQFMKFLVENANKEHIPKLDHTKRIKDMGLNEKTIGILSIINTKFWCTPEQKEIFNDKLKENQKIYEEELRKKYNPNNLFKDRKIKVENNVEDSVVMVEYKEPFLTKVRNWLKRILK